MRIRSLLLAASLLPLALATTAARDAECVDGADPEEVVFCEASIYASCDNAVRGKVIAPTNAISLKPDPPTESFESGAGCGTPDEPIFGATEIGPSPYEYYMTGFEQAGNVDSITVELHFLLPNSGYSGQPVAIDLQAALDGTSLFGDTTYIGAIPENPVTGGNEFPGEPAEHRITVPLTVSESGLSAAARFTLTNVRAVFPEFAGELGAGEAFRTIELMFGAPHAGVCQALPPNDSQRCVPFGASPLVMGAVEVPTGVIFNASAEAHGVTVDLLELTDGAG